MKIPTPELLNLYREIRELIEEVEQTKHQVKVCESSLFELADQSSMREKDLSRLENELESIQKKNRSLESDLKSKGISLNQKRDRLMRAASQKEVDAFTHEIEKLESEISDLETEELMNLEKEEEVQTSMEDLKEQIAGSVDEEAAERERLEEQVRSKKEKAATLEAEYKKWITKVPEGNDLQLLQNKINQFGKTFLSKVLRDSCGDCRMQISSALIAKLNHGDELVMCEDCGRILYL